MIGHEMFMLYTCTGWDPILSTMLPLTGDHFCGFGPSKSPGQGAPQTPFFLLAASYNVALFFFAANGKVFTPKVKGTFLFSLYKIQRRGLFLGDGHTTIIGSAKSIR